MGPARCGRSPQAVEVCARGAVAWLEDKRFLEGRGVVDALRDVPGVDVVQSGSLGNNASVFIRGAESSQSLILFDGVEVNSATLGVFNFGNITTDDVGRIEVLRGAGGTLYGSEAIGGVINVLSKKGEGAPHFSIASAGGNIGTASELATLAGESGIVAYSVSLGYLTSAGFRPVNDDFSNLTNAVRVDVTPIEHGTLRGFWRFAQSSLGLANNDIGAGLGPFLDPDAREHDEFYLGKGEWEHTPSEHLTYRVSGAYSRTLNEFSDVADAQEQQSPSFFPPFFQRSSRIPSDNLVGETQVNYSEGKSGVTTAGFEAKEQSGRLKSVNLDGSSNRFVHSRSNYAGYVQQQLQLLDTGLTAVGGFRVDGNQDFGREVSSAWSLGYLQDWGASGRWDTHLKGSYAEGFKAPTFNDLLYPHFGNRNLDAEVSSEYDGGFEQHLGFPWLAVDATYFARRTKNLIQFQQLSACSGAVVDPGTNPGDLVACNVGRVDVQGVETGVQAGPFRDVWLRGNYSYLDFNVAGGGKLLRRPHNRMSATLNYAPRDLLQADDAFNANLNVTFVGERTDVDPLTFNGNATNPMYARADLALRYDMPLRAYASRIGWFARVQNLFDRNYDEVLGFRSPPINVLAGAQLTF